MTLTIIPPSSLYKSITVLFILLFLGCEEGEIPPNEEESAGPIEHNDVDTLYLLNKTIRDAFYFHKDENDSVITDFYYNDENLLIKQSSTLITSEDPKPNTTEYFYDSNGILEEVIKEYYTRALDNYSRNQYLYSWDEEGKLEKINVLYNEELVSYMTFDYPEPSYFICNEFSSDGELGGYSFFYLDEVGNVEGISHKNVDNVETSRIEFEFDYDKLSPYQSLGNIFLDGAGVSTQYMINNPIRRILNYDDGQYSSTYEDSYTNNYDQNGLLKEVSTNSFSNQEKYLEVVETFEYEMILIEK